MTETAVGLASDQLPPVLTVHAASTSDGVTVTFWVPPLTGAAQLVGVTVNVAVPAACVTVTAWPDTVATALRLVTLDGFGLTVNVTLPLPVPLDRLSVSHDWLLVAAHGASVDDAVRSTS